jgi:hypothetical protein
MLTIHAGNSGSARRCLIMPDKGGYGSIRRRGNYTCAIQPGSQGGFGIFRGARGYREGTGPHNWRSLRKLRRFICGLLKGIRR